MNLVGFGLTAHDSSVATVSFYIGKQKDSLINMHTQAWIGQICFKRMGHTRV